MAANGWRRFPWAMSGPLSPTHSFDALEALSLRQWECLQLAARGLSSAEIGARLLVSPRTVDEHLARACRSLEVRTRVQAVARLAGLGALEAPFRTPERQTLSPSHGGAASCSI
ncbi:LuxR C-terminal-related transcriptional regulator [Brevundimonas diminuta]|uniref:LuxR C-terminal-related transcriptional regulator n=1 Tax=Brevundimonas diminuta TaxID=293 RepID=UPI0035D7D661